jgi:hypothetical protein
LRNGNAERDCEKAGAAALRRSNAAGIMRFFIGSLRFFGFLSQASMKAS